MPELEGQIAALDALLTQVSESPSVVAIREMAEDSGHLDDDWLLAVTTGTASEEEERNGRRHIVFCDQCADLLLNRGGEVDDDEGDDEPIVKSIPSPTPEVTIDRSKVIYAVASRIAVGLLIAVCLGFVAYQYLPHFVESDSETSTIDLDGDPLTIASRGVSEQESGRLSVSRLAYLRLLPQADQGVVYAYVFVVGANGEVIRLEPKNGRAKSFDHADVIELPDEYTGFDLRAYPSLAAGQRVSFLVFTNETRISVFEGEIFEVTTKLRMNQEAKALGSNLDEAGFEAFANKLREIGFPGRILATSIRLIP